RRKQPDRRKGLLLAGAVVLLLALIGGVVSFVTRGPPPPPPVDPQVEQARALLQEARTAFRRGDFAEAVRLAEEAEELLPGVDSEGFLEVARKELSIVQAFQQVRLLMEKHAFEEARELLEKTPRGTTLFTDEERERLEKELETRATEWLVQQVEALLEARDVEGARALIRRLPMERQPMYLGRLAELEALLAQEAADEAARDRTARLAAARRAKLARAEFIAESFRVVEARFNANDYSRAALECDRVIDAHRGDREIRERAKLLKKLIPRFARVYLDAQRKLQLNALASAARPLRSAAELYRQIGFDGPVGRTINEQLAVTSMVAGKTALARNDLAGAAGHFREALRLRPDDPQATAAMEKIQDKLDELYMQAYVQRDREPDSAVAKFRLVVDLATEGSELKEKAQAQLEALQQ
ncbi:MAG TPA: FHA domain-containing protein, partial [Myxococcaceae bacterium]|nr:FHA domain-containing protein [Myxococcaceae bacterium]